MHRDGFSLLDVWNFSAFKLTDASGLDLAKVAELLSSCGRLEPDGGHAWLSRSWIVSLLVPPPTSDWLDQFARMIEGAKKFGWVDSDRDMIRAHVERSPV